MQQEDRRIGGDRIDLLNGGQALFCELMRREATDHPDPLRRRRDRHLSFQHRHGVCEAAHAVPAQLHVEVQATTDDVEMVIDQARQNATAFQVDRPRRRTGERHHVVIAPHRREDTICDRDRSCGRVGAVQRCEEPAS
jgi:hypothetical protein